MNLRTAFLALALLASTVAATPAPKAAPVVAAPVAAPSQTPQDAALGFTLTLTGFVQPDANGPCHMTFVQPQAIKFVDKTIVWVCVR